MGRKIGNTERELLQLLAGGVVERRWLNDVVLTKAINAGYAERYAETMVRMTEAGMSRLDKLQD